MSRSEHYTAKTGHPAHNRLGTSPEERWSRGSGRLAILLASSLTLATPPLLAAQIEDPGGPEGAAEATSPGSYSGPFGLGIVLGVPTGITSKLMMDRHSGLQLHAGWSVYKRSRVVLVFDYLYHLTGAIPPIRNAGRLAPYLGIGGRFSIRDDDGRFGVRIPIGLSFMVSPAPLEIFVEVALGVGLVPQTDALLDGGLGGRFYF